MLNALPWRTRRIVTAACSSGDRHELGLDADLHHEVGGHQVDLVAGPAADQVQAGRHGPQHPPAVAVELVVGRRHPKMPPVLPELPAVVVVTGTLPSMARMRWSASL